MREDLVDVVRQKAKELVLDGRQVQLLVAEVGDACRVVDSQVAVLECRRLLPLRRRLIVEAPQRRADSRQQLAHGEGLGEVVVRACVERADLVGIFAPCRDDDDGHLRPAANGTDDLDAVDVGKPEIEEDHVRRARGGRRNGASPGALAEVAKTLRVESRQDEVSDRWVILDYENRGTQFSRHLPGLLP